LPDTALDGVVVHVVVGDPHHAVLEGVHRVLARHRAAAAVVVAGGTEVLTDVAVVASTGDQGDQGESDEQEAEEAAIGAEPY